MKRTTAREIAVQLSFYACTSEKDVDELLNEFFMVGTGKQISVHDFYFRLPFPKLGQIRNLNAFASLFTADNAKPAISWTTPA